MIFSAFKQFFLFRLWIIRYAFLSPTGKNLCLPLRQIMPLCPFKMLLRASLWFSGEESACSAGDVGSIPGSGRFLGKGMATHSSILAWRIPWTEETGGLQSMGSQRVRRDLTTKQQQQYVAQGSNPLWNHSRPVSSSTRHTSYIKNPSLSIQAA